MSKTEQLPAPIYWVGWFFIYFASVVGVCAVTGMIVFMLVGSATNPDLPALERAIYGFKIGGKWAAMVWAPAISLVLCVMQAYRRNQRKAGANDEL